ncbi:MAG: CBS domain-containing protein [Eubacteriales bacterium]|nr:CBS domain-containing protein [Eubacteriales bacterium]MDD3073006.1 CBS domain-containing protein [Eubacteriales bacterium]MDD4768458.1 CBS domain-containing protein [Eubacteriales bacterium]
MFVKNRMTRKVITVSPEVSLYEVLKILEDHNFDGIPVVDGGKVVGVVDEKTIMREFCACCAQQNQEAGIDIDMPIPFASTKVTIEPDKRRIAHFLHRRTVSELLHPNQEVVVINADEPIEQASYTMFRHEVDLLPVVDDDNQLVGILTKGDVLRVFDEILGYGPKGGDRVMFAVPDVLGRLADVTNLMQKNGIKIETVVFSQSRFASTNMLILKVEKGKGPEAEQILERNGFKIL